MSLFKCDLCLEEFTEQFTFFGHLKAHYDVVASREVNRAARDPSRTVIQGPRSRNPPKEVNSINAVIEEVIEQVIGDEDEVNEDQTEFKAEFSCYKCGAEFGHEQDFVEHTNVCTRSRGIPSMHMQSLIDHDYKIISNARAVAGASLNDLDVDPVDEIDPEATNEIIKQVELIRSGHGCMGCVEKFSSKAKLEAHIRKLHPELSKPKKRRPPPGQRRQEVLKCQECERIFNHRNSLVYHMRSHTGERPHTCHICGKSFFATSALKVHMRLHSGEKPYKCEYEHCGRHFRQWGDLKYHMISIHSEIRQYQCEFCGKDFARKYSLIVHRRIHTQERNYKCEFCEKCFRASSYLQNHRRIHTGEKPHSCSICGKPFRVRSDMKRHMASHSRDPNRGMHNSSGSIASTVIVNGANNQEQQIITMGTHHISIRDGETIQVAMLSDGQITIASAQAQNMTIQDSGETLITGDVDTENSACSPSSPDARAAHCFQSKNRTASTTVVSTIPSSQVQTGLTFPAGEGEVETVTIRDSTSGTLYVWPVFMNN